MRIFIKNKIMSLRGSSTATDDSGAPVYQIVGKVFSITRKKRICSLNGFTLYTVRNKFFNFFFHKAIIKDGDGNKVAYVRNTFSFRNKYKVSGYHDEITIDGEFLSFNMTIAKNGTPIGMIHRDFNLVRDCFILDSDDENMPFLVALVIAIDNIVDDTNNS